MSPAPGAEKLKAVLDTNIYIAAFAFPHGRNGVIWRAARTRRYRLVVSPPIVQEVARVLRSDFRWQDERIHRAVRAIARIAGDDLIIPRRTITFVKADPDDNRILECAAEGGQT